LRRKKNQSYDGLSPHNCFHEKGPHRQIKKVLQGQVVSFDKWP
jgi:hypothetical protein